MHWRGEVVPTEVVDAAIERLADEDPRLGDWLADSTGSTWPTSPRSVEQSPSSWSASRRSIRAAPATEGTSQWPLGGPIACGPRSTSRSAARGATRAQGHRRPQDRPGVAPAPRRPALLRPDRDAGARVPPRLLATYSLDSGMADTEMVTEGVLRSALRRMLDAIQRRSSCAPATAADPQRRPAVPVVCAARRVPGRPGTGSPPTPAPRAAAVPHLGAIDPPPLLGANRPGIRDDSRPDDDLGRIAPSYGTAVTARGRAARRRT